MTKDTVVATPRPDVSDAVGIHFFPGVSGVVEGYLAVAVVGRITAFCARCAC
jgi:hypothetical protein